MIKTAILPAPPADALAASLALTAGLVQRFEVAAAPLPFDEFMHAALYTPGLGYYCGGAQKFGAGGDFTTAPEMTALFGAALAAQVAQVIKSDGLNTILEFGAGSGKLAAHVLRSLRQDHDLTPNYQILDVSPELRERQRATVQDLAPECAQQLSWISELPAAFDGVVLANEVLDAMPVKLLQKASGAWSELCVAVVDEALVFSKQPSSLSPPVDWAHALPEGYLTEIAPQAEAFMRTMATWLTRGVAFIIDYGFPESEYYHPQRSSGTLMCHYQHLAHPDPLLWPGLQDITAHVNFTGVALAAQDAGLAVLGYTSQARFLLNCGILNLLEKVQRSELIASPKNAYPLSQAWRSSQIRAGVRVENTRAAEKPLVSQNSQPSPYPLPNLGEGKAASFGTSYKSTLTPNLNSLKETAAVQKLLAEHEMGELFKVLALGVGLSDGSAQLLGFTTGDRSHTL